MRGASVTVLGAGLMGHGIAQVCLAAGARVTVYDPVPDALVSVPARIAANLSALGCAPEIASDVVLSGDLAVAVSGAEWVFEAAPERLELKQELLQSVDAIVDRSTILATNSSVIPTSQVAALTGHPERVVGTHWWNPPYLVPLVEVIRGERTSDETVQRTMQTLSGIGKIVVEVRRDVPGFIGNRLQHALWREAFALVDAGVCDAETIDTVVKASFGARLPILGPMENADLVGLDLTLKIHEYVLPALTPPSDPSPGLRSRVAEGRLGMRTGEGWREWGPDAAQTTRDELLEYLRAHLQ